LKYEGIQLVVGLALTDPGFFGTFMSDRPRALAHLSLSEEEAGVLLRLPGRDLQDVSRRADRWIDRHTPPVKTAIAAGVHDWL